MLQRWRFLSTDIGCGPLILASFLHAAIRGSLGEVAGPELACIPIPHRIRCTSELVSCCTCPKWALRSA